MAMCETCGNDYSKSFQVMMNGKIHTFDCFECAVQLLAPACARCGCSIIGHGVERNTMFYCCEHCARHSNGPPIDEQENVVPEACATEPSLVQ